MINKRCTLDGDFICQFGFGSCLIDQFTIKNLGGIVCVNLRVLVQTVGNMFELMFRKSKKDRGIYSDSRQRSPREVRIIDQSGKEIVMFYGISELSYTKKHGVVFVADTFKIIDNGDLCSRWLIHDLEPTPDEIFEDMSPTFQQISQSRWCSKEHIRCLNEVTEKLKSFKKNNIIKVKKGKNGPSKSNCWMPKH